MMSRRVVITGMGVVAPNAHGLEDFEAALRGGCTGIRGVEELKDLNFACQVAGIPEGMEAVKPRYFTPDILVSMKAHVLTYGCIAAIDAWKDAGLAVPDPAADEIRWDTGAIVGTGGGGSDYMAGLAISHVSVGKVRRMGSTQAEQAMVSGVSARIGGLLALGGWVSTNSSACTTGTEAVIQAFHHVREGRAERMVAGGAETHGPFVWSTFDAMRVLAADRNHEPAKASRPMSATASGFVPSSGAGVLVLESLGAARERGARIHAEVLSGTLNCGGHRRGGSMTAPNPEAVQRCVRAAVSAAGIHAEDIDAINGHLTGTMADPLEIRNWREALGVPAERLPWINSTKSLIGHALGAAGAIESVAAVLQVEKGFVHGSVNCEDLHPDIEACAARIPQRTIDAELRIVAKAGFGFGDVNGCVIYRKWEGD
jgi:3-oxoacyl-(acyl-carrier-protein) synthase